MATNESKPLGGKYSPELRASVLRDALMVGQSEASRRHGVPQTTISGWVRALKQSAPTIDVAAMHAASDANGRSGSKRLASSNTTNGKRSTTATTNAGPSAAAGDDQSSSTSSTTGKRSARRYTPSQKANALEFAAKHGMSAAAKHFGISRFALRDWQRKVQKAAAGEGPSPTSGAAASDIEAQRDREILAEWNKHAGLGPSQVRNQLRRRGIKVSVATVRRVMEDAGYRPPKVKREPHDQRYESVRPNHRWHLDFVHRHIHRTATWTLIVLDDYSRFVVGHGVDDAERSSMVLRAFEEAVARYGKPERVMHDRGAAFWSWRGVSKFTALLEELGIDQEVATDKELNGKIEVFNANLQKEFFNVHRFYDLAEMKRRLATHLHFYNHGRTHHALGGLLVPADRYYGRADEVLARIEAGALRESDELELRERALELFKVVSRNGAPEVWLLGQRLNVPLGT
jgi:putative transposase